MTKYTKEQLKGMADQLIEMRSKGEYGYLQFVLNVSVATRTDPNYVISKIDEYARYSV